MRLFKSNISNIVAVTYELLTIHKVKVNIGTLNSVLKSHPEFPSFASIKDCLKELNVKSEAYQVDKDLDDVTSLPFPILVHFPTKAGDFGLIYQIENNVVVISDGRQEKHLIPKIDFLQSWGGIYLFAESDERSGEKNFIQNRTQFIFQKIKAPASILFLVVILGIFLEPKEPTWLTVLICCLKAGGLAVTVLLLAHTINSNNPIIKRICGSGIKNNCSNVLKSKSAKLTMWLSWSEIGFFYFFGSLLTLLVLPVLLPVLAWMNLVALPYTAYSLIYQYLKKSWCLLCCSVQAILILEGMIFNLGGYLISITLSSMQVIYFLICMFIPITIWVWLRPLLVKVALVIPLQNFVNKYKYDLELFKWKLKKQTYHTLNKHLMPIVLGNPKAKSYVIIISDPFCEPCAEAHRYLYEWINEQDEFKLILLFYINNDENDIHTKVVRHFMALNLEKEKQIVVQALNEWYNNSNRQYEVLRRKYPVQIAEAVIIGCEHQKRWRRLAKINFTPTILVNGYMLPEQYTLKDLRYLVN